MPFELETKHIQQLLSAQRRLADLMPAVLDIIVELTTADRGFLMLHNSDGELVIQSARNRDKENLEPAGFEGSMSIVRKAVQEKQPVYVPVLPLNADFSQTPSVRAMNLQSVICFPLLRSEQNPNADSLLGILYIDSSSPEPAPLLRNDELELMQGLVQQLATSVENAQLFEDLQTKNKRIDLLNEQLQHKVELQEGKLAGMQNLLEDSQRELAKKYGIANLVGKSAKMMEVYRILQRVVPTDASVLIEGESGTGKELIARYIHYYGPRASKPLVSINCAAFNDDLLESELFGHRKGAFTGADQNKIGLLQLADGGTLFLDEIGDMSMEMQKKLLRTLQNGEVRPIGSKETYHIDVRTIAASNQNFRELIQQKKFREDLFYRLDVIHLDLPPLRERLGDIPVLIDFFSGKIREELQRPLVKIPEQLLQQWVGYNWPGNVRQLENELRRFFILESEYRFEPMTNSASEVETLTLPLMEKRAILKAIDISGGNKTRAAELLGIPLRTLYEKLKRYEAES